MKTIDSVNDMESIRKALGASRSTTTASPTARTSARSTRTLHPDQVRRMVLDGNVDPRRVWYQANLDQDVAFDRNIKIWFGWLAKYDDVYHLGTTAEAGRGALLREQQQAARQQPAGGMIGPDEWTDIFLGAGYYVYGWEDLAEAFSAGSTTVTHAAHGDCTTRNPPARATTTASRSTTRSSAPTPQWPQSWSTWERDNWRVYVKAPFLTWDNAWYNAPCLYWHGKAGKPVKVDGAKVPAVLLIDETYDAATPFAGQPRGAQRFPNSVLIAGVGGTTHAGSLSGVACIDDPIADYLATGALPDRGAGRPVRRAVRPAAAARPDRAAAAAATSSRSSRSAAPDAFSLKKQLSTRPAVDPSADRPVRPGRRPRSRALRSGHEARGQSATGSPSAARGLGTVCDAVPVAVLGAADPRCRVRWRPARSRAYWSCSRAVRRDGGLRRARRRRGSPNLVVAGTVRSGDAHAEPRRAQRRREDTDDPRDRRTRSRRPSVCADRGGRAAAAAAGPWARRSRWW